jgi:hypothetical protein
VGEHNLLAPDGRKRRKRRNKKLSTELNVFCPSSVLRKCYRKFAFRLDFGLKLCETRTEGTPKMRRKMKFVIRRLLLGIVTLPIVFLAYGIIYFGLGLLTEINTASVVQFQDNCATLSIPYVIVWLLLPQIQKYLIGEPNE